MKFRISSTIPTVQYGNIMPELEYEGDYEEALAYLGPKMEQLWAQYYNKVPGSTRVKLRAFVGGEIYYDDLSHTYTNESGEVYLSGSRYAKQFEKPFDGPGIAKKMADKYGVSAKEIAEMWELKARTSREFGTALHSALQLYGQYDGLAAALERTTHLHDHPVIKQAVEGFYEGRAKEKAEYEVLIVDHDAQRAGRIDRLLITGKNKCRVQDFKTNATIDKSLPTYWKQLEFYAGILEAHKWVVEGLDIFHWNGEWRDYEKLIV